MNRLPAEVTTFIGRGVELARTISLLRTGRLVAVTGVGGVGKSRLALRAASQVSDDYPDGVVLVRLDTVSDPDLVAPALADACGLSGAGSDPLATLIGYLQDKDLLLLLDSCEHVGQVCGRLVDAVLDAAPGVRVLATSQWRWPPSRHGERVLRLDPLTVPEVQDFAGARELDAVELFADRAAAVWPRFVVGVDNWAKVVRLCRLLDGLPLAVELAAAWTRVLPLEEILSRVDDRFRLLVRKGGLAPPRQRSLLATVERTYELCSAPEQLLWARLSVFRGTFDLTAVEAVCDGVDRVLFELIDKSVVVAEKGAEDGVRRYRMLDTLCEYGRDRLRTFFVDDDLPVRHRDYFMRLAECAEAEWHRGEDRPGVAARVRAELPNLRAVLEFCSTAPGQQAAGLRLAVLLHFYWLWCDGAAEGRHRVGLALARGSDPSRDRAVGSWLESLLATITDAPPDSRLPRQAEAWALAEGDDLVLGQSQLVLAAVAARQGDSGKASELAEDAVARLTAAGRADWAGELLGISELPWSGHDVFGAVLVRALGGRTSPEPAAFPLTQRERQVATLVAEGLGNRAIAVRLNIAQRTVETHVNRILRKLDLTSRVDLAGWPTSAGGDR